jgi:hypothetical protein
VTIFLIADFANLGDDSIVRSNHTINGIEMPLLVINMNLEIRLVKIFE